MHLAQSKFTLDTSWVEAWTQPFSPQGLAKELVSSGIMNWMQQAATSCRATVGAALPLYQLLAIFLSPVPALHVPSSPVAFLCSDALFGGSNSAWVTSPRREEGERYLR